MLYCCARPAHRRSLLALISTSGTPPHQAVVVCCLSTDHMCSVRALKLCKCKFVALQRIENWWNYVKEHFTLFYRHLFQGLERDGLLDR